jgi:NAD(P)-dependent dehydrogenase (short-subunit alcohol dehydrogenase family)
MFRNVIAIVSGGASGLGAATASYLVRHGARVIVADLPVARTNFLTLKESLLATTTTTTTTSRGGDGDGGAGSEGGGGGGGSIEFAAADVTSECEISSALDMAEEAFGDHGKRALCSVRPPHAIRSRSPPVGLYPSPSVDPACTRRTAPHRPAAPSRFPLLPTYYYTTRQSTYP